MLILRRPGRLGNSRASFEAPPPKPELPDPKYLMMLKMMDPDIDLSNVVGKLLGIPGGKVPTESNPSQNAEAPKVPGMKGGGPYAHKLEKQNKELKDNLGKILDNQNKMIEGLSKQINELKNQKRTEGEELVQEQIKRLEHLIEKKQRRAEEQEFHYELKRVKKSIFLHFF